MTERSFFKMLPVQILIFAMASVNSLVDGAVAGRFLDATAVGVIGLYYTVVRILDATGAVLVGGSSVICGRFMGAGDLQKTNGVFRLNLTVTFLVGACFSLISFLFPRELASLLGADASLAPALATYIAGYAIGIVPQLLSQQLSMFLQLERQNKRGYTGVGVMIVSNILLDLVFVAALDMGIFGLALATALSYWLYFLVLIPYYFTKQAQLRFSLRDVLWEELMPLIKTGLPGAILIFCFAIRALVLNRLLLSIDGSDGLAANSAFNMVNGLVISFCTGTGSVVRTMSSISIGEEDRDAIRDIVKTGLTKAFLISLAISACLFVVSPFITLMFFSDPGTHVYQITLLNFRFYCISLPIILILEVFQNYLQASGHKGFVIFLAVFDGFVSVTAIAVILAPFLGVTGVWAAMPAGNFIVVIVILLYIAVRIHKIPRCLNDLLVLPDDFGAAENEHLILTVTDRGEVSSAAEKVQRFCEGLGVPEKTAFYAALSTEEMAGNIVQHGFPADNDRHEIQIRVIKKEDGILLRIKDNCIPFNPKERAEHMQGGDPVKNIGLRMVMRLANELNYQNLLGLNVLTVRLRG